MDATTQAALETALNKVLTDRRELDGVIAYLSAQLGRPVPDSSALPDGGGSSGRVHGSIGKDPVEGVADAEFFGKSSTVAALEVLRRFGDNRNTLKTKQIFDALKKGGVAISTEEGLYTSLSRSHNFKKVGRGLWGLTEWYPATTSKAKKGTNGAPSPEPVTSDDESGNEVEETG